MVRERTPEELDEIYDGQKEELTRYQRKREGIRKMMATKAAKRAAKQQQTERK